MTVSRGDDSWSASSANVDCDKRDPAPLWRRRAFRRIKNVSSSSAAPSSSKAYLNTQSPQRDTYSSVRHKKKKGGDDNDSDNMTPPKVARPSLAKSVSEAAEINLSYVFMRFMIGSTLILYVLNQKHLLPKPVGAIVSRALFWPTLPITVSTRFGKWMTEIDDVVVIGGAPFGFANIPERLHTKYGVRGVINMCDEYSGPQWKYNELGIRQLRLRTVDHFEPSVEHLKEAVAFLEEHENYGERVYVHCRAGHGRSAAVVFAWLLYKNPSVDPEQLNLSLCKVRNVRKQLWKQPNIMGFQSWLNGGGRVQSRRKGRNRGAWQRHESGTFGTALDEWMSSDDDNGRRAWQESKGAEEFEAEYSWDESSFNSEISSDENSSEDEKDYQLWKKYNDKEG